MTITRCFRCRTPGECILVRTLEVASGPGYPVYACTSHARSEAAKAGAPGWLRRAVYERVVQAPVPRAVTES
ncbi:hypothetical protein ACWGJ2_00810 [Streptomyces sp. NPDC054796]